jgi:hypothetical protein
MDYLIFFFKKKGVDMSFSPDATKKKGPSVWALTKWTIGASMISQA